MKKFTFLLFASAFLFLSINAQWSTDPSVNNCINNLSGEQAIPKIATCTNGDSYIGFFSNQSGNYDVRLQRLDPQGNEMWATNGILVSDHLQMSWLTDWDMTVDPTGYAILTFQDIRNSGNNNVVVYRIAPDGSFAWGADGIALSNSTAFDASPKVVTTAAGNAIFAWQADDVIILQKVDASGNLQWGTSGITLSCPDTYSWPQLLPVGTDEVILKYFHDVGPSYSPTRHVYAQKYDANGTEVWTTATTVSNAGGISAWTQIFPFINDGSDGFYMAWYDDRDNDMNSSVFVQHISNTGVVLFQVNGVEAATQFARERYYPGLALPPDSSEVYVVWNEMDADQNQRGIYGQKLSSSGTRLWPASGMVFIEISGTNVYPVATRHSPSDFVIIYEEYSNAVDAQVKAMRIDTSGAFVWSPGIVTMCSVNTEKVHSVANNFNNNQWIASWEDDRNGNKDIYAQNIQLDGTLGPYVPQTGFIEGTVTLNGGSGDVTQVEISAGGEIVNPDNTGFYSMEILFGTYDVIASLPAYYPDTVFGINVVIGQITPNVDFVLDSLPTGSIEGNVVITSGPGNMADVVITAGTHITTPDVNGDYSMVVEMGTYNVTASLSAYVPDTVFNVDVLEGQITPNVDFTLNIIPYTGFIEGTVELQNGAGDLTQVNVSADTVTVNPDATGYYIMEIAAGTWDVSASLSGFYTQVNTNVVVDTAQVSPDIDFYLLQIPDAGFIEGYVSLSDGIADVTETTVSAANQNVNPDQDGFYLIYIESGSYTVTATHPYTESDSITGIVVEMGQTTDSVDFVLNVIKADLICKALDLSGNILNNVSLEIYGPDDTLSGVITQDSLVFECQLYGIYEGNAECEGFQSSYSQVELGEENQYLIFTFDLVGIFEDNMGMEDALSVYPNPFTNYTVVEYYVDQEAKSEISIFNHLGQEIESIIDIPTGKNKFYWDARDLPAGIYFIEVQTGQKQVVIKAVKI